MANSYATDDLAVWTKYKAGDTKAKWELLRRYDGMVGSYAAQHSNVLPKPVVEAKLKRYAVQAFDTYKPAKNVALSTHVMNYFQKLNRDNYTNQHVVRLPENIAIGYGRYMKAVTELTETHGRDPNTQELSQHLGWSVDATARAKRKYHKELVESKQQFEPGFIDSDISDSVIRFVYYSMSDAEKYLFEHKTGYLNNKIYPMSKIREDLKLTPYQFNRIQLDLADKLQKANYALQAD